MRTRTGIYGATILIATAVLATTLPVAGAPTQATRSRSSQQASAGAADASLGAPGVGAASPSVLLSKIQQQLSWRRRRLAQVVQQERWALSQLSGAQERLERAIAHPNQTSSALTAPSKARPGSSRGSRPGSRPTSN